MTWRRWSTRTGRAEAREAARSRSRSHERSLSSLRARLDAGVGEAFKLPRPKPGSRFRPPRTGAEKAVAVEKAIEAERQACWRPSRALQPGHDAARLRSRQPSTRPSANQTAAQEEAARTARAALDSPGETYSPLGEISSRDRQAPAAAWPLRPVDLHGRTTTGPPASP